MRLSYAISWQEAEAEAAPRSGRLELLSRALGFEGSGGKGSTPEEVLYADLSAVRIARDSGDRLSGRPTLILERRTGGPIRIASVGQPGILSELAEQLVAFQLDQAPPFDPDEAGLSFAATPGPGDSDGGDVFAP
jgi:hypothetical protein